MQKFKEATRPGLSWLLAIALVVFTAKRLVPTEVFVPLASAAITYWFAERSKEKERQKGD